MSDTIRYGPQAMSICAMTPSRRTPRTMPCSRLRGRRSGRRVRTLAQEGGELVGAQVALLAARARRRSRPSRSQRRSVSTLTPKAAAAAPMRIQSSGVP